MENKEVALKLLEMYLSRTDERVSLDDILDAYLRIVNVLDKKKEPEAEERKEEEGDLLFDFKEPVSLSKKD